MNIYYRIIITVLLLPGRLYTIIVVDVPAVSSVAVFVSCAAVSRPRSRDVYH